MNHDAQLKTRTTYYDDFASAWYWRLRSLVESGIPAHPRGIATTEQLAVSITVTNARNNILVHASRNPSYRFMVAEFLWIASGSEDVASIGRYNRHIERFSDDGETFYGAYGPRLLSQMNYLVAQLSEPDTRQAVVTIWTPNPKPSKDIPCTVAFQVLPRQGKLHGIVTMRSSDVWLGLPYDFYNFSMLLSSLAYRANLEVGSLTMNLGSSHLYEKNREEANKVLKEPGLLAYSTSYQEVTRTPEWYRETLVNPTDATIFGRTLLATNNTDALDALIDDPDHKYYPRSVFRSLTPDRLISVNDGRNL